MVLQGTQGLNLAAIFVVIGFNIEHCTPGASLWCLQFRIFNFVVAGASGHRRLKCTKALMQYVALGNHSPTIVGHQLEVSGRYPSPIIDIIKEFQKYCKSNCHAKMFASILETHKNNFTWDKFHQRDFCF